MKEKNTKLEKTNAVDWQSPTTYFGRFHSRDLFFYEFDSGVGRRKKKRNLRNNDQHNVHTHTCQVKKR